MDVMQNMKWNDLVRNKRTHSLLGLHHHLDHSTATKRCRQYKINGYTNIVRGMPHLTSISEYNDSQMDWINNRSQIRAPLYPAHYIQTVNRMAELSSQPGKTEREIYAGLLKTRKTSPMKNQPRRSQSTVPQTTAVKTHVPPRPKTVGDGSNLQTCSQSGEVKCQFSTVTSSQQPRKEGVLANKAVERAFDTIINCRTVQEMTRVRVGLLTNDITPKTELQVTQGSAKFNRRGKLLRYRLMEMYENRGDKSQSNSHMDLGT